MYAKKFIEPKLYIFKNPKTKIMNKNLKINQNYNLN